MPATLIAKRFQASNFVAQAGSISGNLNVQYRLDGLWVIDTWFTNSYSNEGSIKEEKQEPSQATPVSPVSFINRALSRVELQERLRDMWIEPPTNFTGVWKTYWVNGYPHYQIQYKNGHYDGEFTSFYPDGSKAVVQHYSNGVAEGEDMGFYRSGRVNYKGQYKADRQVGHWTWYKEDGSVESEKDYDSK